MKRSNNFLVGILKGAALVAAVLSVAASCSKGAKINATVEGAPDSELVLKALSSNKYTVIDTVKTDAAGHFACTVPLKEGQPEFVYLFSGEDRIASMILQKGEKVKLTTDLHGNCSVEGSPESAKLIEVEQDEARFANELASYNARLGDLDPLSEAALQVRRDLTKSYISYYRSRVKYVMENSHSLSVIPVLYQVVGDGLPVFGQPTDAMHFRSCCDSLMTVYPQSQYVKALDEEARRRKNILDINAQISSAQEFGYPDLELPDIKGEKVRLSTVPGKLKMVYFWNSEETTQKIFNFETVKPLYEQYKASGFEVYAVSLDTDKTRWATTVRQQGLQWINVCDGLGGGSPSVVSYNVRTIPTVFFIKDEEIIPSDNVKDAATLRSFVVSNLR